MMENSFVVSCGGRKNVKKQKAVFLPEVFVENEGGVRHRSSSLIKHSTPYQSSHVADVQSVSPKHKVNLENSVDSGFDDWSVASSSRCESIRSDYSAQSDSTYKTPHAKPVDSLWESFATPLADFKQHFKSRPSFVDDRVKVKLNLETLITGCLGIVMFSSIVFSVYMGTHLTGSNPGNGKYRSIEYGTNKRIQTLREEGRIIDYDIKDEFGNTLGGKKAAIQFAYEQKYGKEKVKREVNPTKESSPEVKLDKESSPEVKPVKEDNPIPIKEAKPVNKRVDNEVRPKVVKTTVEEPILNIQNAPDLSVAELSRKIDELNSLLQADIRIMDVQPDLVEIDNEINTLKDKKKKLIQRVKPRASTKPAKPAKVEKPAAGASPSAGIKEKPVTEKPAKTKVLNPLTKSIPKPKQTKAKNSKKNEFVSAANEAPSDEKVAYPGSEDYDVDPGLVDYPDDPAFRGKDEV
jgi:hypothetical protein